MASSPSHNTSMLAVAELNNIPLFTLGRQQEVEKNI
jgi:hypothetical protein